MDTSPRTSDFINVNGIRFTALHPQRVLKLIYLDAADDYVSSGFKAMQAKNPVRSIQPPGANDDHFTIEDYTASIKRACPALTAI